MILLRRQRTNVDAVAPADGGPWAQQYSTMALADRMMEIAKATARDRRPGQR